MDAFTLTIVAVVLWIGIALRDEPETGCELPRVELHEMTYLRFDAQGIHFAEMFQQQGAITALPGLLPDALSVGDEWEEELVREFPHVSREE